MMTENEKLAILNLTTKLRDIRQELEELAAELQAIVLKGQENEYDS